MTAKRSRPAFTGAERAAKLRAVTKPLAARVSPEVKAALQRIVRAYAGWTEREALTHLILTYDNHLLYTLDKRKPGAGWQQYKRGGLRPPRTPAALQPPD